MPNEIIETRTSFLSFLSLCTWLSSSHMHVSPSMGDISLLNVSLNQWLIRGLEWNPPLKDQWLTRGRRRCSRNRKWENFSISLSFLSSQISKHVSDSRYRAWPRVRQFLQDLEPGSIVCDVGKSAARALWSKWDSQSGTMANFMLCISSVCMYASLGVFKAGWFQNFLGVLLRKYCVY